MKKLNSECSSCAKPVGVSVITGADHRAGTVLYPQGWSIVVITTDFERFERFGTVTREYVLCPDCAKSITLGQLKLGSPESMP